MDSIVTMIEIVEAAEREVLAHTIESTRGLHEYFCLHGSAAQLERLQQEAVRRGLYRYMGERYTEVLEDVLRHVRYSIPAGRIRRDRELKL